VKRVESIKIASWSVSKVVQGRCEKPGNSFPTGLDRNWSANTKPWQQVWFKFRIIDRFNEPVDCEGLSDYKGRSPVIRRPRWIKFIANDTTLIFSFCLKLKSMNLDNHKNFIKSNQAWCLLLLNIQGKVCTDNLLVKVRNTCKKIEKLRLIDNLQSDQD
jgi:hypothetical protein